MYKIFGFNKIDKEYSSQDTRFIFIDDCPYWKQFSKNRDFLKNRECRGKKFFVKLSIFL